MEIKKVIDKFGGYYAGDDETYEKGTHYISARRIARRFNGKKRSLDACCGAGFVTIRLARASEHVVAVDINQEHLDQARENVGREGLTSKVTFIHGDITDPVLLKVVDGIDGAFLDPNWTPDGKVGTPHATTLSGMQPNGEVLFGAINQLTPNIAFRLPKEFGLKSLSNKPSYEIEEHNSQNGKLKFYCAYFGDLRKT